MRDEECASFLQWPYRSCARWPDIRQIRVARRLKILARLISLRLFGRIKLCHTPQTWGICGIWLKSISGREAGKSTLRLVPGLLLSYPKEQAQT
jgi:hypothetical protein